MKACKLNPRGKSGKGFSLLELLGVLALIGTAGAWILPAIPDFLRNNARRSALDQVLSSLSLARTLAITRGNACLWAVPPPDQGWPTEYSLRAFALFRKDETAKGWTPVWIQETPWHLLPDGIRFEPGNSGPFSPPRESVPCPLTGRPLPVCGLEFTPMGSLERASQSVQIQLTSTRPSEQLSPTTAHHADVIQIRPSTGISRLCPTSTP